MKASMSVDATIVGPSGVGAVSTSAHALGTPTAIVLVSSTKVTKSAGIAVPGFGAAAEADCPASARAATDMTVAMVSVVALIISILTRCVDWPRVHKGHT